jgi:hypothetical protein
LEEGRPHYHVCLNNKPIGSIFSENKAIVVDEGLFVSEMGMAKSHEEVSVTL